MELLNIDLERIEETARNSGVRQVLARYEVLAMVTALRAARRALDDPFVGGIQAMPDENLTQYEREARDVLALFFPPAGAAR